VGVIFSELNCAFFSKTTRRICAIFLFQDLGETLLTTCIEKHCTWSLSSWDFKYFLEFKAIWPMSCQSFRNCPKLFLSNHLYADIYLESRRRTDALRLIRFCCAFGFILLEQQSWSSKNVGSFIFVTFKIYQQPSSSEKTITSIVCILQGYFSAIVG